VFGAVQWFYRLHLALVRAHAVEIPGQNPDLMPPTEWQYSTSAGILFGMWLVGAVTMAAMWAGVKYLLKRRGYVAMKLPLSVGLCQRLTEEHPALSHVRLNFEHLQGRRTQLRSHRWCCQSVELETA
jgi:hypothetical protein